MTDRPELSVIVPVSKRHERTGALVREYLAIFDEIGRSFEIIIVFDGAHKQLRAELDVLAAADQRVRLIQLGKAFGEATALSAGAEFARGDEFVTLPAYYQVEPAEIPKLVDALGETDMVVGARWPRHAKSRFEVIRRQAFHWLLNSVTGGSFDDLGCSARAFRRIVAEEISVYGDQQQFLALLAQRRGFRVTQINLRQSDKDRNKQAYRLDVYFRRVLDILTVVFLVRFTRKPLRFFGMIGTGTFLFGFLLLAYATFERLALSEPLADRPILLISSLFMVLGLQMFALGLIGELIIFTHAREVKEYTIQETIN